MAALALAAAIGLAAGPALGDNRDDRDRRDEHRPPVHRQVEHDNNGYRAYDYRDSGRYVYAPPAVVYAPYGPPALDFVFPINIR